MPISVASPRSLSGLATPLRAIVRAALALEGRRAGEIGIVLTDDATIRDLNRRYRGLDRATDVLSFGYHEATDRPVTGDLVISLDRVRVQARRFRVSEARELARLTIHGALHLAGLDHKTASERHEMRLREARVLRGVGTAIAGLERGLGARRSR
jgi:probable rRNA maturation factor